MAWEINGQYMETCNCDYLCPCPLTGLTKTTHGYCIFAMAFNIDRGRFDGVSLDGAKFVVIGRTPASMGEGNWEVGLVVDAATDQGQRDALAQIVSGQAGGPMANLAPMFGTFHGVEARAVRFEGRGGNWSVVAGDSVDQAIEGARGLGGEFLHLDNTAHPANSRLGLAHATRSRVHAFGIDYEEMSGRNNGHFAPFSWSG